MAQIDPPAPGSPPPLPTAGAAGWRGFARDMAISGILPWIAVVVLTHRGVAIVPALALSSLIPLVDGLVTFARRRAIDAIGCVNLAFIAGSIAITFWTGDVHVVLLKGAVLTCAFGLACLGSLFAPKPLLFFLSRQFTAGHDAALMAAWDARWQYPEFRNVMRLITAVWGVGLLLEVVARVIVAYTCSPAVTLGTAPFITYGIIGLLIAWSVTFGNAMRRKYEG